MSLLRLAIGLAILALLLRSPPVRADGGGDGLPIVSGGREAEVLALVRPFAIGKEIVPGWQLASVAISTTAIRYVAAGPAGDKATLRLEHPERAASAERSPSFALHREGSSAALEALVEAVRKNDGGHFWPAARKPSPAPDRPRGEHEPQQRHTLSVPDPPSEWRLTPRRAALLGGLALVIGWLLFDRRRTARA